MDPASLVSTFNALPRSRLAPSGSVPNHWHISVRKVPLNPPGRLLFILQPQSHYVHAEGPMGQEYETASTELRATMCSMLLLRGFNQGLGAPNGQGLGRPWSWVCNDAEMAGAMGEVLRRMGVLAPEGVGFATSEENKSSDEDWEGFLGKIKELAGGGEGAGTA